MEYMYMAIILYIFPLLKFITNRYNCISYMRYMCVYNNEYIYIYMYLKRRMGTRGEMLTDLNKNINISIIDNHNESKIASDIYYILFKMACSDTTRRSTHISAYTY